MSEESCYTLIDYGDLQNSSCCTDSGKPRDSGSFGEIKNCNNNNSLILKTSKSKTPFTRELDFINKTKMVKDFSSYAKMYKVKAQGAELDHIIAMEKMDKVLDQLLYSEPSISNLKLCANKLINTVKSFHTNTNFSHNDIKPSNIGATSDVKEIKLIDLGSTIHAEEDANKDDSVVGTTILYRPCVDLNKYDHEFNKCADLWAVGCVLFEIVAISNNPKATNHYLFDMTGINPMMLLNLIKLDDLKYILGVNPYNFNQEKTPATPLYTHRLAKYKDYLNEKRNLFKGHSLGTKILNLMKPVLVLEKKQETNDRVGSSNANVNVKALYNTAVLEDHNNSNNCTDNDNINIAKTTRPKNTTESRFGKTSINKQVDTVIRGLIKDLAETSTTGGNKKAKSKRPMTLEERRKYEQKMRIDANIMNAVAGEFRRNHKIQQLLHSSENVRKPNQKSKTPKSVDKKKNK